MENEIYQKIISKKEFSQLPQKDVELAWRHFEKRQTSDEEKIRLTRDLLRKVFSAFTSDKLLSPKNKDAEWILKKHISTRERFSCYEELYSRLLKDLKKPVEVFDLGAGVNGFSYKFFPKNTKYFAIEAVGQLVNLMNDFFNKEKLNAKAIHSSLFGLEEIKKIIEKEKGDGVIFLFKVIDSLEMLKRDYSKELLLEIVPLSRRCVVSFATESLISRKKFSVKRYWIENFIKENFNVLDDFVLGPERYIVFENRN